MSLLLGLGILFLIISVIAYAMGARGTAAATAGVGRTFLWVFLVLAIILVVAGLLWSGGPRMF